MIPRIAAGRTDLVFEHLAGGGAATAADEHGTPLIRWCAYYGDVSAIRVLLPHGETLASLGDNLGLDGAAFHGHWRLAEFLLENGADPNAPLPDSGETPLHAATARSGPAQTLVVRVLLAAGADATRACKPGVETGAFMRDVRTRGETPLHRAAAYGDLDMIERLIAAGAQKDAKDSNGDTPLGWASWARRSPDILRPLCWGPHRIHPDAKGRDSIDTGLSSMAGNLLGEPRP
jgi:ankyrin repeat protein